MIVPVDIVRGHYAHVVSEPVFVEQVEAHEVNSANYFVRCGSETATPSFVLKRIVFQDHQTQEVRLRKIRHYARCARESALLPDQVITDSGNLWVEAANCVCSMMAYCEGHEYLPSAFAFVQAARALASLHQLFRLIEESFPHSPRRDDLAPEEMEVGVARLRQMEAGQDFVDIMLSLFRGELQSYYDEYQAPIEASDLPRGLIHWDFHPANAIYRGEQLVAVVDMDSIALDFRMQGVAFACSRFVDRSDQWRFLAAYHQVDRLRPDELRFYPAFVRREAVKRMNWIIRANVFEGLDMWRGELDKHCRNIESSRELRAEFDRSDAELLEQLESAVDTLPQLDDLTAA